MSEEEQEATGIGDQLSYLKDQYKPARVEAGKILEGSGFSPESPEFKRARAAFAKRLLQERDTGEIDVLTGLRNRRGFLRRVNEEMGRARSEGHRLWLLVLDANDLRKKNNSEGHDKGDEYLRKIAEILSKKSKSRDIVARTGGDEFCVVLVETDEKGVAAYWKRMVGHFTESQVSVAAGGTQLKINEDPEDAISRADKAMYVAKSYQKTTENAPMAYLELKE